MFGVFCLSVGQVPTVQYLKLKYENYIETLPVQLSSAANACDCNKRHKATNWKPRTPSNAHSSPERC